MTTALATVTATPHLLAGWSKSITPSSFGRADACIRSEAMPHVHSNSWFAAKGTIAHKFLADCLDYGRELALGMVEDASDIEWLMMLDLERLPAFQRESYAAEVAIAYDPRSRTARELGRGLSRAAAHAKAKPGELVGIIDVLGMTDELAIAHDYKTGWGYIEPAEVNWQLRSYALFAARMLGKTSALYSVIRTRDNGSVWSDVAQMDELDLLAHEERLLQLLARREKVRALTIAGEFSQLPPLYEGKHCRYCPALAACPAKTAGMQQLFANENSVPGELDAVAAAEAWKKIRLAKKTLERWEAVLRDFARQQPLQLGDGEILGEKEVVKESIVAERAREVMEKAYGQLGSAVCSASEETETTITKARFRSALKKLLLPTLPEEKQKITHLERDALKLLREGRAISTTVSRSVLEHVPPKLALPAAEEAA